MNELRIFARAVVRFITVWFIDTLSVLAAAALFPGISFAGADNASSLTIAASAAFLLGVINLVLRPLLLLLALPFGFVVIFIAGFLANPVVLTIASALLPSFQVDGWVSAFLGGIVIAIVNTTITSVITIGDDDSFYQGIVERIAARQPFRQLDTKTCGLVMMEIDGLSYHHIKKAIAEGWMPTLKQMMDEEGYRLARVDCGLPSQTSACQAGILFGENFDIPAFRWYDKDLKKLIVSSRDAPLINERYAHGKGLLRGGSSINNMMNGDAEKSILTLADLFKGTQEEQHRRAEDMYLLMLNPYFITRTLVLYFVDIAREVYQALRQQIQRVEPRLNRFEHFYPLLRAATTVLMRDVSAYLTILDIVRGTPALYVTWPGYDEVAHHSGPWTSDAFKTLRQYDKVIARVREVIEHKAPRPYDLLILSDHGQSNGWTFKQRYKKSLKEYIEECLPQGTTVMQTSGGDDGSLSVSAMAAELGNMQQRGMGGRLGKRVVRNAQRLAQRGVEMQRGVEFRSAELTRGDGAGEAPQVTVCGSGNLGQVYFDLFPRRINLSELNHAYPGMVDSLVRHEGIGVLVAYNDEGVPMAFGKSGARNLHTGQVTGDDPMKLYGDADLRAEQLRRIADFPHAGDLTVISNVYPDGTVAAMEELVGNHGGLGGEQTDAFIFHPPDFQVPDTKNAVDFFPILNAQRGVQVSPERPVKPQTGEDVDAWSLRTWSQGLRRANVWLRFAMRAAVLDPSAYRRVTRNGYMTAPALLIAAAGITFSEILFTGGFNALNIVVRLLALLVVVLLVFGAGRFLGGKASFTATLRGVGFAQATSLFALIALIPSLAPFARFFVLTLTFAATWIAGAEAQRLRGWRTFVLPFAAVGIAILAITAIATSISGTAFTLVEIARQLGVMAR